MVFLHILLAIQAVIAAYQHIKSSIHCPDVVSFYPFQPPPPHSVYILSSNPQYQSTSSTTFSSYSYLLVISTQPNCQKVTYANTRSIHNKYPAMAKFISDNDTDLFAKSETWIRPDTTRATLCKINPPGYKLYQQPWEVHLGGGLG